MNPASSAPSTTASSQRGQVLVIVAAGMIALIGMVGLVVDGGYAWTRQRVAQNAADAAAKAGTVEIQHFIADGDRDGNDVACATLDAADRNDVVLERAVYSDAFGSPLSPEIAVGPCSGVARAIPSGAQGVRATTLIEFDTFLMAVVGIGELDARASATAVVGEHKVICPAAAGCGALPVTFPQTSNLCDSTGALMEITEDQDGVWQPWEVLQANAELNSGNLAIIPLCDTAPGSVGWLDFGCHHPPSLSGAISTACHDDIPIPAWLHAQTGNPNCCEGDLNAYTGSIVGTAEEEDRVVAIPIFSNSCRLRPANNDPTCEPLDSEWSGTGDNLYYYVDFWVGFKLDRAYTQGGDAECKQSPGHPVLVSPTPAGKVGCLKGWLITSFTAPGSVSLGPIAPGTPTDLAVVIVN
jgi:hypothetical protein